MNVVISPKIAQESAKMLAEALKWEYINPFESEQRDFRQYDTVFNYGFSRTIKVNKLYNLPENVNKARNKIECLKGLKGKCKTVLLTEDKEEAIKWVNSGRVVVSRAQVKGDNGKGLVYCSTLEELEAQQDTKFWTRYIPHTNEYRINVFKNKVLSIYDKKNKNGFFKFTLLPAVQNVNPQIVHLVNEVYKLTNLDWMGIDVLRTDKGTLFFLEVNSAPVLFPYTLNKLVQEIKNETV